jgi:hypothetical protein
VVDPHGEDYSDYSPYQYVLNNPIILVDPDGRDPRQGNTVITIDFSSMFVNSYEMYDEKPDFKIYDPILNKKAFRADGEIIGEIPIFPNPAGVMLALGGAILDLEDSKETPKEFFEATRSKSYGFPDFSEEGLIVQRTVKDMGEGFENFVTEAQYITDKGEVLTYATYTLHEDENGVMQITEAIQDIENNDFFKVEYEAVPDLFE